MFVLSLVVYLTPGDFSPDQRLAIIFAALFMVFVLYLVAAYLTARTGDPLYSPAERILGHGSVYGTDSDPQPRRRALNATKEEPPSSRLLESEAREVTPPTELPDGDAGK